MLRKGTEEAKQQARYAVAAELPQAWIAKVRGSETGTSLEANMNEEDNRAWPFQKTDVMIHPCRQLDYKTCKIRETHVGYRATNDFAD